MTEHRRRSPAPGLTLGTPWIEVCAHHLSTPPFSQLVCEKKDDAHHPGFSLGPSVGANRCQRKVVSSLLLTASGKGCKEARVTRRDCSLPWFTWRGAIGMPLGQAKLQEEWTWLSAHLGSRTTSEPLLHASPRRP